MTDDFINIWSNVRYILNEKDKVIYSNIIMDDFNIKDEILYESLKRGWNEVRIVLNSMEQ